MATWPAHRVLLGNVADTKVIPAVQLASILCAMPCDSLQEVMGSMT